MTNIKTQPVTGTSVSTASLLNGKTRHDRNKRKGNVNVKAEKPLTVAELTAQLAATKSQLAEARKQSKVTAKTPVYLREGITGKQVNAAAKGLNQVIKAETGSLSYCLNHVRKNIGKPTTYILDGVKVNEPSLLSMYPKAKASELTPANVLKFRTAKQVEKGVEQLAKVGFERFTFGQVIQWSKNYFKHSNGFTPKVAAIIAGK